MKTKDRKDVVLIRIPTHIGVIPDGNRRWAQKSGMQRHEGYQCGVEQGLELMRLARQYGVQEITYYGFTMDNCKRPEQQIQAFTDACVAAAACICREKISFLVLGNTDSPMFPDALREYAVRKDVNGGGVRINMLVNYGWEWDLANIHADRNSRKQVANCLRSADISRMDLIIRWGGMRRLSGFLPVQSVYADFFVVDTMWPDFTKEDFYHAVHWYEKQDVTLGG